MRIVGDECRIHGDCRLNIDAIAARAGVHRTTVQNALREAQGRGDKPNSTAVPIISVQERRRRGQRSLTNIVRVISPEWLMWLRRRGGGGFKTMSTTDTNIQTTSTQKPGMVPRYRPKGLGEGSVGYQPTEKGGTAARGGPI